ncbi:hypothetical protein KUV44_12855 [Marinobacter daepoensis]|uniref:Toxin CptA n=1 Tax=Marinobacter daepoensis TaxID=262077 RepID=A0ABS3BIV4_9GAMM|nr:hypothetical protein [Marinobacter daepoensis]MBY6080034.1 hypothetical protein [Marinobacter daepoensis]
MSSRIELTLSPSWTAGLLACLPWGGLSAAVLTAGLTTTLAACTLLPVTLYLGWQNFRRCGLLTGPGAVTGLTVEGDRLHCALADGRELPASIHGCSTLGATFLALKIRPTGSRSAAMTAILLTPSRPLRANVCKQAFRRLRMWLLVGPAAITR